MKLINARTIVAGFTIAAAIYAYRTRQPSGRLMRVPYDFRKPSVDRLRERFWNPADPRLFTPAAFGVGWSVNAYHVFKHFQEEVIDDVVASESERVAIPS
ncbi:MAG: hypothetical protein FJ319_01205 [SAR202 cluster bacterium]|nr:hypothetical protein [SAR202 cluster bacterium]